MSTPKVVLITGASSGFGAMTARALADAKHVVYAGMRNIGGRNARAAESARRYAVQRGVTLRPVEMDVSDQASVDAAVGAVLAEAGRVDVVIHNAGHMVLGPTEAFTPEQLAAVYDTNVLSTQRVNRAVLPALRARRDGLVIWVGSSSSRGGTPPYLGPYFAAKAARMPSQSATPPSSPGSESRRRSSFPARSRREPTTSPMPDARPTNTSRRPTKLSTQASWTRLVESSPRWHPTMPTLPKSRVRS
jgi:short-subunit dehydrogenase involved in D-alanine esterification of teichoic acids